MAFALWSGAGPVTIHVLRGGPDPSQGKGQFWVICSPLNTTADACLAAYT